MDDLYVKGDVRSDEPTVNYHSAQLFASAPQKTEYFSF